MKKEIVMVLNTLLVLVFAWSARAADAPAPATAGETAENSRWQHEKRGDEYTRQKIFPEAIKEFDAAIALAPEDKELYVKKGIALYMNNQVPEAIGVLDKSITLNRGDRKWPWFPLYHKAIAQARSGDMRGALQSLDESIKLNPNHENHLARAMAHINMQQPAKALEDVRAGMRFNPDDKRLPPVAASLEEQVKAEQYAQAMAREKGAQTSASGLVYFELKKGEGKSPQPTDTVKVHYHGTLPDGTVFDSSVERKEPASFPLNGVIPCWTEGVQKMQVGGKAKLICPAKIAYGMQGAPPMIKPGATLIFEVELLAIE